MSPLNALRDLAAEARDACDVLVDAETGAARVAWQLLPADAAAPEVHVVVKFFDSVQRETWTLKIFGGPYDAVRAHWRTQTEVEPGPRRTELVTAALAVIIDAVG